jgi:hypothetical protein
MLVFSLGWKWNRFLFLLVHKTLNLSTYFTAGPMKLSAKAENSGSSEIPGVLLSLIHLFLPSNGDPPNL